MDEPFGRTSLEASANGCAVIISNKGLPETLTNGVILKKLTVKEILEELNTLYLIQKKNKFTKIVL